MPTPALNTPEAIRAAIVTTVSALIEYGDQAFYNWQSAKLGNDLFISDPDRANRIWDAAENGADGSTHAEVIEDFREYAREHCKALSDACFSLSTDSTDSEDAEEIALFDAMCAQLEKEVEEGEIALGDDLDKLENWHTENGSLREEIG